LCDEACQRSLRSHDLTVDGIDHRADLDHFSLAQGRDLDCENVR
jgi:hypothetical protein